MKVQVGLMREPGPAALFVMCEMFLGGLAPLMLCQLKITADQVKADVSQRTRPVFLRNLLSGDLLC